MDLASYLDQLPPPKRREFAKRAKTKMSYINLIRCGVKQPGHQLAKRMHQASGGVVSLERLRPDIWGGSQLS